MTSLDQRRNMQFRISQDRKEWEEEVNGCRDWLADLPERPPLPQRPFEPGFDWDDFWEGVGTLIGASLLASPLIYAFVVVFLPTWNH